MTPRPLIFIRHAAPTIVEGESPKLWHLSEKGRGQAAQAVRSLISAQITPSKIITSRELKAVETGQIMADALHIPVESADNLHEHDRRGEPFFPDDIFVQKVTQFFAQPDKLVFGRESADMAYERFAGAVQRCTDSSPNSELAIVAHGTVMSLYVGRRMNIDPFTFWKTLKMASIIVLSSDGQMQVVYPTE
jgi:broad specificity phosphatase PhoE